LKKTTVLLNVYHYGAENRAPDNSTASVCRSFMLFQWLFTQICPFNRELTRCSWVVATRLRYQTWIPVGRTEVFARFSAARDRIIIASQKRDNTTVASQERDNASLLSNHGLVTTVCWTFLLDKCFV